MQSREELCNGRFPAAALSDDAEEFFLPQGKRDVIHRLYMRRPVFEMHGDIFETKQIRCGINALMCINVYGRRMRGVHVARIAVRLGRVPHIHLRHCCEQRFRVGVLRMF